MTAAAQDASGDMAGGAGPGASGDSSVNKGVAFVGMIPLVSYDLGRFKLNAV